MSHDDLTAIPLQVVRGTSVDYRRTYDEFIPPDGWSSKLYIAGQNVLEITATTDGNSFVYALSNANSTSLAAGMYLWEERVTKAGKSYTADSGTIEILDSPALATAGSMWSFEQKALAAVEAACAIRLGIGGLGQDVVESYTIGNRSFDKMKTRELLELRSSLRRAVKAALRPGTFGPTVLVRFGGTINEGGAAPWSA